MNDPQVPGFSGIASGAEKAAEDAVQKVVDWYDVELRAERGAPTPDPARVAALKDGRRAALADRAQLLTADPREAAELTVAYADRLRSLAGS
ncbi:hypothetical protein M5362_10470 [Streptomyces sp. Je 1-79]|uniref:hypothetical protein n=1 Tax=Streptomyces sp. Je 1-79 TaxID=2943847 RepID=UPI0021A612A8|nr:hypothetical protein [Streptomyces sp. Je 1-79]MCT4353550.1 hypothetical protein [Streptomyces sp. Je 1-79]